MLLQFRPQSKLHTIWSYCIELQSHEVLEINGWSHRGFFNIYTWDRGVEREEALFSALDRSLGSEWLY